MSIMPCRFCGRLDVELFPMEMKFDDKQFLTYVCRQCLDVIDSTEFLLHYCQHCGNMFLTKAVNCHDTILLIERCGICEKGGNKC